MSKTGSGVQKKAMQWTMGEQPDWIGVEEEGELPEGLVDQLLSEDVSHSLMTRGYGIVTVGDDVRLPALAMDCAMKAFSAQGEPEKVRYVTLGGVEPGDGAAGRGEEPRHSPNEYHGFARVEGLKEQFMIRTGGAGCDLSYPGAYTGDNGGRSPHFGTSSVALYQVVDGMCRRYLGDVAKRCDVPAAKLVSILDPVNQEGSVPAVVSADGSTGHDLSSSGSSSSNESGPSAVVTQYHIDGYVSSSLLDVFHYYPRAKAAYNLEPTVVKRHLNNHLSHTDSGIITAVLSCAEPGLEVYDQSLEKWICLEQLLYKRHHEQQKPQQQPEGEDQGKSTDDTEAGVFSRFLMVFLGDSCVYLAPKQTKPCLHRVSCSRPERRRFAYVFKMRTMAEATAPRYQEDYILANIQRKAIEAWSKA